MERELQHWGIKGMRWGVRRYQNKDGSLTKAGQKRYNSEMEKVKAETKKIKNQQRTAAKIAKLDAAKKNLDELKKGKKSAKDASVETDEQKRERILANPTAKDVYENRHLFSNKEVGDLYIRLNNEENIKRLMPKEVEAGKARTEKIFNTIGDMTTKTITLAKAYNAAAAVINAFNGTDSISLPRIDIEGINKGNKETRKQEKKKQKDDASKPKDSGATKNSAEESNASGNGKNDAGASNASASSKTKATSDRKNAASKKNDPEPETVAGEFVGSTKSSKKTAESGKKTAYDIIDAEFVDVTPSSTRNTSAARLGQSYVAGLLEAPKDDD